MAHTIMMCFSLNSYCLSCRRSRETSSSCSKTVLHRSHDTIKLLERETLAFIHQTCGPNSPDLNPVDYKIWDEIQQRVYQTIVHDLDELKQRLINQCVAWLGTKHHQWRSWWVTQTSACVYSCQSRTFWAFALTKGHAYDNFNVLSLLNIKRKLLLFCQICEIFAIFDFFCISQGSVATRLRCSGNVTLILLKISWWAQQWKNF